MEKPGHHEAACHPIGVVARRTGIAPDLLRAWERRYQAVDPGRAETGRRLYSDQDIERLRLLRRLVEGGRRISDVAGLSPTELESLIEEDEREAGMAPRMQPPAAAVRRTVDEALDAVARLDRSRLESLLANAAVDLSRPVFRSDFIVPLMREIGDRWHEGSLRVMHEHLATAAVRGFLAALMRSADRGSGPAIIVTTLPGQAHEIGALLAAQTAAETGWKVIYLGPDMPVEEIAAAVKQAGARAVALSIVQPGMDPDLHEALRRLRQYVGRDVDLFAGGNAAIHYQKTLAEIGAFALEDLSEFQRELEARLV